MKFTGKLKGRLIDCHTILFKSEEDFRQAYDELKDYEKLTLEIKPYRAKRSLDANSYLWVLLDKLAEKLDITRWQAYLNELKSTVLLSTYRSGKKISIWHSQCSGL